jgi:hypothetical protein
MTSSTVPKCIISNSSALLTIALASGTTRVPSIFTDQHVLERPPFALFYEIANFISKEKPSFHWDSLFFNNDCSSRQNKMSFIVKVIAIVSRVTGIRFDIYIASPPMLLYGHDISSAHALLQALATASMVSAEVMSKAVAFVADAGANLFNIGVKTRKSFISVQAIFRGWLVRRDKQLINASDEHVEGSRHERDSAQYEDVISNAERNMSLAEEEYEALMSRKSNVEKEILEAEARLKKEKHKLIRILQLKEKSRSSTIDSHTRQYSYSRPKTAPSSFAGTNIHPPVSSISVDEEFAETVIDIKGIQSRLKNKEKMLKARILSSKNKEAELKLQEERITQLSEKIRNQKHQLQQQKLQFERERVKALPPTLPETAASCDPTEQTERKLDTKAIKAKLRQRVRLLDNREANIIRMAKELRKREMQLAQREHEISESFMSGDDCYEKVYSTSTKQHQIPLHKRKRSFGDNQDDAELSVPSHGDSELRSSMNAIEEGDEEEETSAGDHVSSGETTSMGEEAPLRCGDQPSSDSNDKPIKIPQLVEQPNITTQANGALNYHPPHEDVLSQSIPKRMIPPQQSHYSNHVFTFEKNSLDSVNDLGHHVDAQLICAVNNLRELL